MRITCDTKDTLPLSALTEFQGGLKKRTDNDIKKIEKSIHDYGFATPFFVWKHEGKNKVLDGHGRLQTVKRMAAKGEELHPLDDSSRRAKGTELVIADADCAGAKETRSAIRATNTIKALRIHRSPLKNRTCQGVGTVLR